MNKIELFGIEFDPLTMEQTVKKVEENIISKKPTHLLGINADKVNGLYADEYYTQIVKKAEIINADGASVVLASRFLNSPLPERVAGIDLMQHLLATAVKNNFSVYFLGAKSEVLEKMISELNIKYPGLLIAGSRNGYFSKEEWKEVAQDIEHSKADLVFIGITSPLKEYLVDYFLKEGIQAVFMGVGGSFDVLSGKIKRAPQWMQKANLEWLFRVYQEPKRLMKRYFVGNFKFICTVLKIKLTGREY
ncbi:WecB/TagA/CpsF family glycosyltransferase [Enterococcus hirae]